MAVTDSCRLATQPRGAAIHVQHHVHRTWTEALCLLSMFTISRFIALVATPYWERLRTIQEAVLASIVKMVVENSIWQLHGFKNVLGVVIWTGPLVKRVQPLREIALRT